MKNLPHFNALYLKKMKKRKKRILLKPTRKKIPPNERKKVKLQKTFPAECNSPLKLKSHSSTVCVYKYCKIIFFFF